MTSLALSLTLVLSFLVLLLPRRLAPIPMLIGACVIPLGSSLMFGSLDFTAVRIVVFFAFIRIIIRNETRYIEFNNIDWAMILFVLAMVITGAVHQRRDLSFVYRLGTLYDTFGFYFSFRCWIREKKDIFTIIIALSLILSAMAVEMVYETKTCFNLFSKLGGLPSSPVIREGRIRAQGCFNHSILAGTVGATSLGLFIALWHQEHRFRKYSVMGIISCIVIVFTCASSGPIMSAFALFIGMMVWYVRDNMRLIRRGIFFSLIALEIVMKSHVWYLIARIDLTGSSTGYHRAHLINNALVHLGEWWLIGTDYTRHWMVTGIRWSELHTDITNYYLKVGVLGGLPAMSMFILIIIRAFKGVGVISGSIPEEDLGGKFLFWAMGAMLFSHTVTFLSVNYYDQSKIFYFLLIALIASSLQFILSPQDNNVTGVSLSPNGLA